jgi:hypothetical protein
MYDWDEACEMILQNIHIGMFLNPTLRYGQEVLEIPPFLCNSYNYENEIGFKIKIGQNASIEIPVFMLQEIFILSVDYNRIFNRRIFNYAFPRQLNTHGCYVHVIGNIYKCAGVSNMIDGRAYQIL